MLDMVFFLPQSGREGKSHLPWRCGGGKRIVLMPEKARKMSIALENVQNS
jgi:hypothetical protein